MSIWIGIGILASAFLLDLILGDPRWLPHPVVGMGKAIRGLERWIRERWSSPSGLKRAGILLPVVIAGGAFLLTWGILKLMQAIHPWLALGAEIALIATTIATKGLQDAGMEVHRYLRSGDLLGARTSVGMIVGRDTNQLQEQGVVRATIETVAENIVDAIVSPLFYAMLGGAPLAMAYRAVNTLDSMVGYKNDKYVHIGWASARSDDIANWIPARITGLLIVMSAWMLRLDWKMSYRSMKKDAALHPSPNSGYPESAVAGALGIRLGGENSYHGVTSFRAYMGPDLRPMTAEDIKKTVTIMKLTALLFLTIGILVISGIGVIVWQ